MSAFRFRALKREFVKAEKLFSAARADYSDMRKRMTLFAESLVYDDGFTVHAQANELLCLKHQAHRVKKRFEEAFAATESLQASEKLDLTRDYINFEIVKRLGLVKNPKVMEFYLSIRKYLIGLEPRTTDLERHFLNRIKRSKVKRKAHSKA